MVTNISLSYSRNYECKIFKGWAQLGLTKYNNPLENFKSKLLTKYARLRKTLKPGATTFSITTLSIATLQVTIQAALAIGDAQYNDLLTKPNLT